MDEITQTQVSVEPPHTSVVSTLSGSAERLAADLWDRIGRLRSRAQRLVWLSSVSALISTFVVIFFAAAALDWWLRPSSLWGRGLLLVVTSAAFVFAASWFIWRRRKRPISRSSVARRLEAVCPELGDRLSSVISLLEREQDIDKKNFPNELADAAIFRTAQELDRCQPESRLDRSSVFQSLLTAAIMLGLLLLFFFWRPAGASLATQRLFAPTSDVQWPQRNHLVLENVPAQVYAGQEFEVFVRDTAGTLPDDVQLLARSVVSPKVDSLPLRLSGEVAASDIIVGKDSIEIRATGGDDDSMPWQLIEVFDSPSITDYRLTVAPPDYLQQESFDVAETDFKVLAGTKISLYGELSLPVQSAKLRLESLGNEPVVNPLQISNDGLIIESTPIELQTSAELFVSWIDANGLEGESRRRWRISVDEDSPPRVALAKPENDTEVTSAAAIEFTADAEDNLGIVSGWFEVYHVQATQSGRVGEKTAVSNSVKLSLDWKGTVSDLINQLSDKQTPDSQSDSEINEEISNNNPSVDPFAEGSSIEITGVAIDTAGQHGQSTTRRLRIVSTRNMQDSIARLQSDALESLLDARTQQEIALEQTESAQARLGNSEEQQQAAADRLQAANAAQQAAAQRLSENSTSAQRQLNEALRRAAENGLENEKLQELRDSVDQISTSDLPTAQNALREAAESLAGGNTNRTEQQLETAQSAQRSTLETLDQLVQSMRRDDSRRAANDQLSELAASQARLNEQSRDIPKAIDAKSEQKRLAERQRELARSTEQLLEQLRDLERTLEAESGAPSGNQVAAEADNIRQAIRTLESGLADSGSDGENSEESNAAGAASSVMRQAANELERGRGGQAENLQQQVQDQLEAARNQLNNSARSPSIANGESSTEAAEAFSAVVQQALTRQDAIVESLQSDPLLSPKTLAEEQADIAEVTSNLARSADAPPGFYAALEDAASDMQTAAALMRRDSERETTLETASAARERLRFIVASLLSDPNGNSENGMEEEPNSSNTDEEGERQQSGVPTETLKLLRATQDFIRSRTAQIVDQLEKDDPLAADPVRAARLESQKRQLADEQARLVQRIEQFVKETEQNDEP